MPGMRNPLTAFDRGAICCGQSGGRGQLSSRHNRQSREDLVPVVLRVNWSPVGAPLAVGELMRPVGRAASDRGLPSVGWVLAGSASMFPLRDGGFSDPRRLERAVAGRAAPPALLDDHPAFAAPCSRRLRRLSRGFRYRWVPTASVAAAAAVGLGERCRYVPEVEAWGGGEVLYEFVDDGSEPFCPGGRGLREAVCKR